MRTFWGKFSKNDFLWTTGSLFKAQTPLFIKQRQLSEFNLPACLSPPSPGAEGPGRGQRCPRVHGKVGSDLTWRDPIWRDFPQRFPWIKDPLKCQREGQKGILFLNNP